MKKFLSWNVNGLRACAGKNFLDVFHDMDADVFCIQETKLQEGQIELDLPGYYDYWNYADKKGYSGTAMWTKDKPLSVTYGMGKDEHDHEGRIITAEFDRYYLMTCYTPNSQNGLLRLDYRMKWEEDFLDFISGLSRKKPLVYCGDLNVAHEEIDLKNPSSNHENAGFTDREREKMTRVLSSGFTDSFRFLYPDKTDAYSWWSYRMNARSRGIGWRIDYFIVSDAIRDRIKDSRIHSEITGSDHCPVELDIDL
jgi:exodeoxyribonuclease-3